MKCQKCEELINIINDMRQVLEFVRDKDKDWEARDKIDQVLYDLQAMSVPSGSVRRDFETTGHL